MSCLHRCSWKREQNKNGNLPFIIPNASRRLDIPIRLHNGRIENYQHVHPDLLDLSSEFENGFEYAMVTTPYVGGDGRYENPSVMFSNNLQNWDAGRVTNPIVPPPEGARFSGGPSNCDNCFVFDSMDRKFYVYYNVFCSDMKFTLHRLASDDCIHWTPTEALVDLHVVSPSVVYEAEESAFYMWAGKKYQMYLFKSHDGRKWNFVARCNIQQIYEGKKYQIWHLTVLEVGKEYWAFAVMNTAGKEDGQVPTHVFFFRSSNGVNWVGYDRPVLSPSLDGWDRGGIYRLGALIKNQKLFVVYSGRKVRRYFLLRKRSTWGLGYAEVDISSLVSQKVKSNNVII